MGQHVAVLVDAMVGSSRRLTPHALKTGEKKVKIGISCKGSGKQVESWILFSVLGLILWAWSESQ